MIPRTFCSVLSEKGERSATVSDSDEPIYAREWHIRVPLVPTTRYRMLIEDLRLGCVCVLRVVELAPSSNVFGGIRVVNWQ